MQRLSTKLREAVLILNAHNLISNDQYDAIMWTIAERIKEKKLNAWKGKK